MQTLHISPQQTNYLQLCIANELAEANRLKRWELLNNNWFEEDGRNRPIRSNKELEDKA